MGHLWGWTTVQGTREERDPPRTHLAPVGGKGRRPQRWFVVCPFAQPPLSLLQVPAASPSFPEGHPWPGLACPQPEAQKRTQKTKGSCASPLWSHLSHDGPAVLDQPGLLLTHSEDRHQQHLGAWRPEIPPCLPQAQDRAPTPREARVSAPHLPSSPAPTLAHSQPSKDPSSCSPSLLVLRDFKTQNLSRMPFP